jgi:hypothetical protein
MSKEIVTRQLELIDIYDKNINEVENLVKSLSSKMWHSHLYKTVEDFILNDLPLQDACNKFDEYVKQINLY